MPESLCLLLRYGLCSILSPALQIKQALRERFGVRSYPAALAFTDMGQDPFVYKLTGEQALKFSQIAAMHRWPLVPPLQVDTVEPLGCSWGPGVNHKHLAQACAVLVQFPVHPQVVVQTQSAPHICEVSCITLVF